MAQLTIELPDQVAEDLRAYLQANPQESLAGLIHDVLQAKLALKDTTQLLALAGIVTNASLEVAAHAENSWEKQLLGLDPTTRLDVIRLLAQSLVSESASDITPAQPSLIEFFRNSPLCDVAEEIDLSRDRRIAGDRIAL